MSANLDVGNEDMVFVPKKEDASASTQRRSVSKRSESEPPDVCRSLMVYEVQLGFLNTGDVAWRVGKEGMNRIFATLGIQSPGVPVDKVEILANH